MSVGISTADKDTFLVPIHACADGGGGITEGETTATAVGFICLGSVKEKIGMEAAFTGAEDVVDGGAILFCILNALI